MMMRLFGLALVAVLFAFGSPGFAQDSVAIHEVFIPAVINDIDALIDSERLSPEQGDPIKEFLDQAFTHFEIGNNAFAVARLEVVIRQMD